MKKRRNAPLPDDVCMCLPELGRVCVWCQNRPAPETVEEADGLKFDPGEFAKSGEISRSLANYLANSDCPWNPDELPDRLKGYGYRVADQDGGTGEEWVTPQEDFELTMIEAARELLDAREI